MLITGLGTAVPAKRYSQRESWEALQSSPQFAGLSSRSHAILRKVLTGDNGIATRHLALEPLTEAFEVTHDALHSRFAHHAPALAETAACRALQQANLQPAQIGGLIISTCTGYLCPGLTSYVSERLGLRPEAVLIDLVGQGCGAALPNLRTAEALVHNGRARHVLSVCVEVCSAAFYLDDDPGVLISACLFGDGAAAAVVSAKPRPGVRHVRWVNSGTVLKPEHRDELRFEQRGGLLRNILKPSVPKLAAYAAAEVLEQTLATSGRSRDQIKHWVWHSGGRDVLLALREHLGLSEEQLRHSAEVLREFGNISSPCVLFVLAAALRAKEPGGIWWMSSFGAGFSCHGALLDVEN
jgi:alkylresorcinol/alkylpyrone synthase